VVAYSAIICSLDVLQRSNPIPYDVRVDFLKNMTYAVSLMPSMGEVRRCKAEIVKLSPGIFGADGASETIDKLSRQTSITGANEIDTGTSPGKTSPVTVCDDIQDQDNLTQGKRRRTKA
jgi:hypothetical protein